MHRDVTLDLVFQRLANEAERVHVLDLGLGAEFLLAGGAHADVGIAAQRAFLHVAVADAGVQDDLLQAREILVRLLGRADVGLADDLDQRHAAAVQVQVGALVGIGKAFVQALAGVLFQVYAGDADFFGSTAGLRGLQSIQTRPAACRTAKPGNLWAGRDKNNFCARRSTLVDAAVQRHGGERGELHRFLVQHRQRARQSEADGTDVGIRRVAKAGGTRTENLAGGQQVDVDLQTDDRLVAGANGSVGLRG